MCNPGWPQNHSVANDNLDFPSSGLHISSAGVIVLTPRVGPDCYEYYVVRPWVLFDSSFSAGLFCPLLGLGGRKVSTCCSCREVSLPARQESLAQRMAPRMVSADIPWHTGIARQKQQQKSWRNAAYWLAQPDLALFFKTLKTRRLPTFAS